MCISPRLLHDAIDLSAVPIRYSPRSVVGLQRWKICCSSNREQCGTLLARSIYGSIVRVALANLLQRSSNRATGNDAEMKK